jgi:pimeloyl-ACP methyl ester carboxylesterase
MSKRILWTTLCVLSLACSDEMSPAEGPEVELGTLQGALSSGPLSTGVTLQYTEQGSRNGDAVILLHGYADSHRDFDGFAKTFPRNFRVFVLDMRGQGASSKPACCYGLRDDFARDVIAFMDSLGIQRAHLVGHSMGGLIAQNVALDFPERVRSLVLVSTAATAVGNPFLLSIQPLIDSLVDPIPPAVVAQLQILTLFRDVPDAFNAAVEAALLVPARILQDMLDAMLAQNRSGELGNISAPTLILYGDQDRIFSLAEQQLLDARIPDSDLIVYPQTGHRPQSERSVEVGRDIASFLRRR